MQELTYILGAGASFQSIPIVKTFPRRFKSFVYVLSSLANDPNSSGSPIRESLLNAYSNSLRLYQEFESHQSFDTYFKKLFHTNLGKINMAKKILHLYFIWEHTSLHSFDRPKDNDLFWKQSQYDKRYDALLAGLLKPTKEAKLYCKTNFITWNYDMNLLCSVKKYFYPQKTFRFFMDNIKTANPNIWNINNEISIINMNGYFYSRYFGEKADLEDANLKDTFIQALIQKTYLLDDVEDEDANYIKFAWETMAENKGANVSVINFAKEAIGASDNVVVIGYTFPLYNRLVDFEYLNKNTLKGKDLFIQDPNSIELEETVVDIFSLNNNRKINKEFITSTMPIVNCDGFFIPNKIFKYKDSLQDIFN